MTPFFSVIVPVYNVEKFLPKCLDSILGQTFADFELILVDDGSPNGCPAVCDEYAARDARVIVLHRENTGRPGARKAGLDRACADYVCFIDSDDYVSADYLDTLHRCIRENDYPDMVVHGLTREYSDHSLDIPPFPAPGLYDKAALEEKVYPFMLCDRGGGYTGQQFLPPYLWNKPGKRRLYTDFYLQDDRILLLEDVPMIYELLIRSERVCFLADCPYHYVIHEQSVLSSYRPDFFRTLKLVYDYLDAHLVQLYPPAGAQSRGWICAYALGTVWDEFRYGHSFRQALRHIREELDATRLFRDMDPGLFPGLKGLYVRLLKHRMYFPVVAAAFLQSKLMHSSVELRYNKQQIKH